MSVDSVSLTQGTGTKIATTQTDDLRHVQQVAIVDTSTGTAVESKLAQDSTVSKLCEIVICLIAEVRILSLILASKESVPDVDRLRDEFISDVDKELR